jgi:sugar lactone lactonase YvrE
MRIHGGSLSVPLALSLVAPSANGATLRPTGLAYGGDGWLYAVDGYANAVYRINRTTGAVNLLAGGGSGPFADGPGCTATFSQPHGVVWAQTSQGPALFVTDTGNHRIRRVSLP